MTMAAVVIDPDRYETVAIGIVERVAGQVIRSLARNNVIEVGPEGLSEKDETLVFDQLFGFFLEMENQSGLEIGDRLYLAALAFAEFPKGSGGTGPAFGAKTLLGSTRGTDLHGNVSFELIQAKAKQIAKDLAN